MAPGANRGRESGGRASSNHVGGVTVSRKENLQGLDGEESTHGWRSCVQRRQDLGEEGVKRRHWGRRQSQRGGVQHPTWEALVPCVNGEDERVGVVKRPPGPRPP